MTVFILSQTFAPPIKDKKNYFLKLFSTKQSNMLNEVIFLPYLYSAYHLLHICRRNVKEVSFRNNFYNHYYHGI